MYLLAEKHWEHLLAWFAKMTNRPLGHFRHEKNQRQAHPSVDQPGLIGPVLSVSKETSITSTYTKDNIKPLFIQLGADSFSHS